MDLVLEMKSIVDRLDPILTLGALSAYCGIEHENDLKLTEPGLEFIQFLFLVPSANVCLSSPTARELEELILYANKLFENRVKSRLSKLVEYDNSFNHYSAEVAGTNAQYFRNWGYVEDVIEVISGLTRPISEHVKSLSNIDLDLFYRLTKFILTSVIRDPIILYMDDNESVSSPLSLLKTILSAPNIKQCTSKIYLSTDSLSLSLNADKEDLAELLNYLSYTLRSDGTHELSEVIELNPVCLRPFVRLPNGDFIITSVSILNSFFIEIITELLHGNGHEKAYRCFNRRRSKYIENKTYELFRDNFPRSEVYNNVHLDDFKSAEKDIVFKYGDIVFIIEVKSHNIKKGLRKSGLRSLTTYLEETIASAHRQTLELKNKIIDGQVIRVANTKKTSFIIDPNATTKVYRMAVLFRELGGLHTNHRNFEKITGDLGDDFLVMTLMDLKVVFEILSSPSERIDYLLQRNKFEKNVFYKGDEMELLGYYLLNRFDVNYEKYNNQIAILEGHANRIDLYKAQSFNKGFATKPYIEITPFFSDLISTLEKRVGDKSRLVSCYLYRCNIADQKKAVNSFEEAYLKIKFAKDMHSYTSFDLYDSSAKVLIRFVIIKHANMVTFKGDFSELKKLSKGDFNEIHSVYLNAMADGEYAGYSAFRGKKSREKDSVIML